MSFTGRAQTTISLVGSDVMLKFPTTSNLLYSVQRADVLASNAWSTISSNILGSGGIYTNIDVGAAIVASRFYRVGSYNPSTNGGTAVSLVQFNGGAPVVDSLVILSYSGNPLKSAHTDVSGRHIFANVPVGSFTIQAYSPDNGAVSVNATGSISNAGALAAAIAIMPGTGSVEVWANYASGDPAASANVYVISGTSTNGPGVTDSAGHLTLLGIPVGSFTAKVYNPTNAISFVTASGSLPTNGASSTLFLSLP